MSLQRRVAEFMRTLVRWPSVNGTADETRFAHELYALLSEWPYFQTHPDHLELKRTTDDAYERYNVVAMVRLGSSRRAVILAGHYDTVGIDDYGPLAAVATDPDALLPRLICDLRGRDDDTSRRALTDLLTGDYLPGRATLDMKSGLAVGLALLERFTSLPTEDQSRRALDGTLIFIATPDEEGGSAGMRSAVAALPAWLAQHALSLEAVINLDATNDQGDGADGRSIYLGSTGKLLASVMFVGQAAHTGNPFAGVSAAFLAAQLGQHIDYNPEFGDALNGVAAPPPVTLRLRDGKNAYDVTTPQSAWCAVNLLNHARTPSQALADVKRAADCAMHDALALMSKRHAMHMARGGQAEPQTGAWQGRVMTYAELHAQVLTNASASDRETLNKLESAPLGDGDPFDWLRRDCQVVETVWAMSGLFGPAAVVCLAAPCYPLVSLDPTDTRGAQLMSAVTHQASAMSRLTGQHISLRPMFLGVSDMSFFSPPMNDAERSALLAHAPTRATRDHVASSVTSSLAVPIVNIGPWGRDYHQRTERLYTPYTLEVLPELVWRVALEVLAEPGDVDGGDMQRRYATSTAG